MRTSNTPRTKKKTCKRRNEKKLRERERERERESACVLLLLEQGSNTLAFNFSMTLELKNLIECCHFKN